MVPASKYLKHMKYDFEHTIAAEEESSVAVSAEILLRSPRKLCICIIKKCIYRIKVSKKNINGFLKKTSLEESTSRGKVQRRQALSLKEYIHGICRLIYI